MARLGALGGADGVADGEGGARALADGIGDLLFSVVGVARALGVRRGAVRIAAGASSRRKVVEVDGDEASLDLVWRQLLAVG